ncbi:MAG TPA: hypothetical protein HPP83_08455 [Candidatus Hydrogenedentes bacterium]|nr:hypothetical protein [Candidatus Hydrogenedentota bacterium]
MFENLGEIVKFRDSFARFIAAAKPCWPGLTVACFNDLIDKAYELPDVLSRDDYKPENVVEKLPAYTAVVLVARYRPEFPRPNPFDFVDLGKLLGNRTLKAQGNGGERRTVEVLDFLIVDEAGSWQSVYDAVGLRELVWCDACHTWLEFSDVGDLADMIADEKWDELECFHREGCSGVKEHGRGWRKRNAALLAAGDRPRLGPPRVQNSWGERGSCFLTPGELIKGCGEIFAAAGQEIETDGELSPVAQKFAALLANPENEASEPSTAPAVGGGAS